MIRRLEVAIENKTSARRVNPTNLDRPAFVMTVPFS